ncbi:hypothetical protein KAR91_20890 [Candidatus Pacearchaeota archaeon]|nr:hypothetical protein [Candidatus Pacearchaeota archaeon]
MDNFVTKVICSSCGKPLVTKIEGTFNVLTIEAEICDPCRKEEEERVLIAFESDAVEELAALKVEIKTKDDRIKELEENSDVRNADLITKFEASKLQNEQYHEKLSQASHEFLAQRKKLKDRDKRIEDLEAVIIRVTLNKHIDGCKHGIKCEDDCPTCILQNIMSPLPSTAEAAKCLSNTPHLKNIKNKIIYHETVTVDSKCVGCQKDIGVGSEAAYVEDRIDKGGYVIYQHHYLCCNCEAVLHRITV